MIKSCPATADKLRPTTLDKSVFRARKTRKSHIFTRIWQKNAFLSPKIVLVSRKITIFAPQNRESQSLTLSSCIKIHYQSNKIQLTMTKADIVNEIAKSTGLDKALVLTTVERFMEVVKDSLSHGENVYLRGFGSFIVKTRSEKTARNISKKTTIIIPEHKIPAFKPARVFMDDVKNAN